jgi:hypothetical protein
MDLIDWESITVGALASHLAGTAHDFARGPAADAHIEDLVPQLLLP